jgi:hypothetical protein
VPGCGCHGHQLGAVEKTADEVDVSERLQGLVPVVAVPWPGVRILVVPAVEAIPCPPSVLPERSTSTYHVKIT